MRHLKKGRKLNRTPAHRKAMLRNMAISLLQHNVIKVTLPRAKELRHFIEPIITLGKQDSLARRRRAFSLLGDKAAVGKLFSDTAPRAAQRAGGYTRILKAGYRPGDNAPIAYIEFVDKPEEASVAKEEGKEKTGSSGAKK